MEACNSSNVCTLTWTFKRAFETDEDEHKDKSKPWEDITISAGTMKHVETVAFIRSTAGATKTRTVSDVSAVWLRAAAVEEAPAKPKNKASWSIFYLLGLLVLLYLVISKYQSMRLKSAIEQLNEKKGKSAV